MSQQQQQLSPIQHLQNLEFIMDAAVKAGALNKMQVVSGVQSLAALNQMLNPQPVNPEVSEQEIKGKEIKMPKHDKPEIKEPVKHYGSATDPH